MNARKLLGIAGAGLVLFGMLGAAADPPAKAHEPTVAIVGERALGWSELTSLMAEAAGGQVLEECALGMVLKDECDHRGIKIGATETRAERKLLTEMLAKAARVPTSEGERLLEGVRRTRGLGELRFKGLLERNAALRAMVRAGVGDTSVTVTSEDIEEAYQLKYGSRVRVRLILLRTQQGVDQAQARLKAGVAFGDVATEMSLDPSSARAGLLDSFSLADSNYPVAFRRAAGDLKPGEVSVPVAIQWAEQPGFAIVRLEETLPAPDDAPSKEVAAKDLELEVRTVRERAQMDKLARKLLHDAGVTVMNPSLNWSWEARQGAPTP